MNQKFFKLNITKIVLICALAITFCLLLSGCNNKNTQTYISESGDYILTISSDNTCRLRQYYLGNDSFFDGTYDLNDGVYTLYIKDTVLYKFDTVFTATVVDTKSIKVNGGAIDNEIFYKSDNPTLAPYKDPFSELFTTPTNSTASPTPIPTATPRPQYTYYVATQDISVLEQGYSLECKIIKKTTYNKAEADGAILNLESIYSYYTTKNIKAGKKLTSDNVATFSNPVLTADMFEYTLLDDGTYMVGYKSNGLYIDTIEIPSEYNGIPVTVIGDISYNNCKKVIVPNSVVKITSYGMSNTGAKEIVLPESLKTIESHAIGGLVEKLNIPSSLENIGSETLSCPFLKELVIPENITEIPTGFAFMASNLTKLSLPSSLKIIHSHAFSMTGLKEVEIPDGVELIEESAFSNTTVSLHFSNPTEWVAKATAGHEGIKINSNEEASEYAQKGYILVKVGK